MHSGFKLWNKAKTIIPGGNMLLSKRPEMFLPKLWPTYFSRAKGCEVWDLDKKKYIDMSLMGVGTNTLGYGHPLVDEAVRSVIDKGNMSTLNCPEEVYLAEALIDAHPWANMVRLCRSGGEANAVAVRIARAASGKDGIAICGYHGWHDWYLAANLKSGSDLNSHHLPDLEIQGVPKSLEGSVHSFEFNDLGSLQRLVNTEEIGVIKMEVFKGVEPDPSFLLGVRKIADENRIVLVVDECTSGFRETYGGLHKKYNFEPDMAVFGKAMGNGYALTAVVGRGDVMDAAQNTFISSTFWTERIGPAAALKTLEVMRSTNSWELITEIGVKIKSIWGEAAARQNLMMQISGLNPIPNFKIEIDDWLACKTYISQQMLMRGYLASNAVFASVAHDDKVLDRYAEAIEATLAEVSMVIKRGETFRENLSSEVCHSHFRRI